MARDQEVPKRFRVTTDAMPVTATTAYRTSAAPPTSGRVRIRWGSTTRDMLVGWVVAVLAIRCGVKFAPGMLSDHGIMRELLSGFVVMVLTLQPLYFISALTLDMKCLALDEEHAALTVGLLSSPFLRSWTMPLADIRSVQVRRLSRVRQGSPLREVVVEGATRECSLGVLASAEEAMFLKHTIERHVEARRPVTEGVMRVSSLRHTVTE